MANYWEPAKFSSSEIKLIYSNLLSTVYQGYLTQPLHTHYIAEAECYYTEYGKLTGCDLKCKLTIGA